jgi:predicted metal-binding protein
VIFALSGRIGEGDLGQLEELFKAERQVQLQEIGIDLKEVRLVDRQVVKFLAGCESAGIHLHNCPGYIREWIESGETTSHGQTI